MISSFRPLSGNEFKNENLYQGSAEWNLVKCFRPLSGNEFKN